MSKAKRKSTAAHDDMTGPPAARRQVSYQDLETEPAPPVPRQHVSYTSDVEHGSSDTSLPATGQRHEIMSCKSNAKGTSAQARPKTDVTYGQTSAFPGLDSYDNEPFYGPANDGLDYLRMVRSEARGIPHVVTADHESDEDEGVQVARDTNDEGYYENGAYVARPSPTRADNVAAESTCPDAQEEYYAALKQRFNQHRARLHQTPSAAAVAALDDVHPISLPSRNENAIREWRTLITSTTPLPAQLASMDSDTVLRILHLTEGQLESCTKQVRNIPANLTLWLWALFGRLDEEWALQTTDIGTVRHVAKMSIKLAVALTGSRSQLDHMHTLDILRAPADDADWHLDENSDVADDGDQSKEATMDYRSEATEHVDASATLSELLSAKKQQLLHEAPPAEPVPDLNTLATLDMIVTVAGEFYGQKDLLGLRQRWQHSGD